MTKVCITDRYHQDDIRYVCTRYNVVKPCDPGVKDWPEGVYLLMVRSNKKICWDQNNYVSSSGKE